MPANIQTTLFKPRKLFRVTVIAILLTGGATLALAQTPIAKPPVNKPPTAEPSAPEATSQAKQDAEFVGKYLSSSTFAIGKINVAKVVSPDIGKIISSEQPEALRMQAEIEKNLEKYLEQLRVLSDDQPIYFTAGIPATPQRMDLFAFRKTTTAENAKNIDTVISQFGSLQLHADTDRLLVVPKDSNQEVTEPAGEAFQRAVVDAFAAVESYPVQLLLVPPAHVVRTTRELMPTLPEKLGGGPSSVLTDGVQWIAIGMVPETLKVEVIVQSADAAAAKNLAEFLPQLLEKFLKDQQDEKLPEELVTHLTARFKPTTDGSQVKLSLDLLTESKEMLALVEPIMNAAGGGPATQRQSNQFKQIMLAMHNYHAVHRAFPVPDKGRDKDGKPLLSWRVYLLPFLEQAALFEEFHLDEPWDSEHNKKLLEKMPKIFARPKLDPRAKLPAGYTTFLAPFGEKTIYGGTKPAALKDIIDGTSNTIAVVDVQDKLAVPWTAPDDYAFDPEKPLDGVAVIPGDSWMAAFADGSVHILKLETSAEKARRYFEMNDGQIIGD